MTELSPYHGSLREECFGLIQTLESLFYRHISAVGAPKFPLELVCKIHSLLRMRPDEKEWSLQSLVWDMSCIYYTQDVVTDRPPGERPSDMLSPRVSRADVEGMMKMTFSSNVGPRFLCAKTATRVLDTLRFIAGLPERPFLGFPLLNKIQTKQRAPAGCKPCNAAGFSEGIITASGIPEQYNSPTGDHFRTTSSPESAVDASETVTLLERLDNCQRKRDELLRQNSELAELVAQLQQQLADLLRYGRS